ncbi:TetR/AcrR family transcriptional regulator [Agarivorans aestuarii]|uniref:TetR/AcrR family transcriptional regulator n=1 Tax=Agarivorans aestuarii TaxID=1563703 RepID=A0ABU7G2R0_9ALTE|nr:TetR/AcrR family transcriptional regulator [Agarivorans aestuarii]MEE1673694.1 TetR/AcrR family transcriptional regulator [Agarivorans aestuarii]
MNTKTKHTRARKLRPEERKQLLITTAIDVFVAEGIGAVKHADVAKAAGVAPPTVFSYFASREQLTTEVLDEVGRFIVSTVVDVAPEEPDLKKRLYQSAMHTLNLLKEKPNYVKVWLMFGTTFSPEVEAQYKHYESQIINALSAIIAAGAENSKTEQHTKDCAKIILGSSIYLNKMILEGVEADTQKSFVEHIVSFVTV